LCREEKRDSFPREERKKMREILVKRGGWVSSLREERRKP
jgi:hypothetical protein